MHRRVISIVLCTLMFAAIFIVKVPKDVGAQVTEEWVARYNGPPGDDDDRAQYMAVDSSGNVYVTGKSFGIGTSDDYATIKYDSDGNELWVARYDGPANYQDWPSGIALDSSGNIYVTGMSHGIGTSEDYATVKYDSSGNEKWVARYNGPGNDDDYPKDLAVDSSGNIYVTGSSKNIDGDLDYITIKYDTNGNQIWVARYNGSNGGNDGAWAIAVNSSGNIYVTGLSASDYATIAYDSFGNELWVAGYNGPGNGNDEAEFMSLDSSGNVYVTGKSEGIGTDFDYATIKYDSLGNELWVARYNGPQNEMEYAFAVATDSFGNVYVTGRENLDTNPNYATIAYNSSGSELWVARYNGPGNGYDLAKDMAIDSFGNVYVTGWSMGTGTSSDVATIAYDSNGNELWVMRYNGPGNLHDGGWATAIDSSQNVYVTGVSKGNGTGSDYVTIKYSQTFHNQPPVADAGPDQAVNKEDVVQFNGSASYDPDGTIVTYEWDFDASDGLWWETGAPPDAFDPNPTYIYDEYGVFIATLIVKDNNGSMDIDTCVITVLVPSIPPPKLYINVSQDGEDVILYWDPPSTPGIDHYLIYRSISQIDFNFDTVWVNTSSDNESGEPGPIPLRSMWNDTKAAFPDNETNYEEQYYYIIRAVNQLGGISTTSRTVGKWTKTFPQGVSTFSLPLEPLETMNTTADFYIKDMNARYIKWMDPVNHIWIKHGDGGNNDTQMEVGKGYEIAFDSLTNYTFLGMPGAMIMYDDDTGFSGFDPDTEAKNLTAAVDPVTGNVTLNWPMLSNKNAKDQYHVLRSTERDGFWNGNYLKIATLAFDMTSYTDIGNATEGTQYYYMIVPVNETGIEGASTYSVGVWTGEYTSGYDTFGIPLKLNYSQTADWYCDNIPNTVGINFYNVSAQRWSWHSKRMPSDAFDPDVVMTEGYQISINADTKYSFIGI